MSADFRLSDVNSYAKWYGKAHIAPELQAEAVYGIPELNREEVKKARLLANPGTSTTSFGDSIIYQFADNVRKHILIFFA